MKIGIINSLILLILSLLVIWSIATGRFIPAKHICSDSMHKTCDSYCVCNGMECPNAQKYARDYQLNIEMDSLEIWDGNRFVGKLSLNSSLDSLILSDNQ